MKSLKLDIKTEAEIQFELGFKLKERGFDVYFERIFVLDSFKNKNTKRGNKRKCKIRVDVLVVKEDSIVCAIEVKNQYKQPFNTKTRQNLKYKQLGYPFFYCWNENFINKTLFKVEELFNKQKHDGTELDISNGCSESCEVFSN